MAYDEGLAGRLRDLLHEEPAAAGHELSEKKMFGGLAFLVAGNMAIAVVSKGGVMVRVRPEETEQLILDFMAEVFFAWWACLYRPAGDTYAPKVFRSLNDRVRATRSILSWCQRGPPGSVVTSCRTSTSNPSAACSSNPSLCRPKTNDVVSRVGPPARIFGGGPFIPPKY